MGDWSHMVVGSVPAQTADQSVVFSDLSKPGTMQQIAHLYCWGWYQWEQTSIYIKADSSGQNDFIFGTAYS